MAVKNLAFALVIFHSPKPPPVFQSFRPTTCKLLAIPPSPSITPLTRAQDVALLLSFITPTDEASPSHLLTLIFSSSPNPQPALQLDLLHSPTLPPLRLSLWCPSFPQNSHKTGIQMNISILRKEQLPMPRAASIRYLSRL